MWVGPAACAAGVVPRPGVEPGLRPSGRSDQRPFRPRAGADGADEREAGAWSARAQCWPSTTTPRPGVVLAALVRLSGLTGEFRPLRVCQTGDHRCLLCRCLYAVPGVHPGDRSCCGAVLPAPLSAARARRAAEATGRRDQHGGRVVIQSAADAAKVLRSQIKPCQSPPLRGGYGQVTRPDMGGRGGDPHPSTARVHAAGSALC